MKIYFRFSDGGQHPILGHVLYKIPVAEGSKAEQYQLYLAGTLSSLAINRKNCASLLALIHDVESRKKLIAEWEGRDVNVTFDQHSAQVDIMINEAWVGRPEGLFPLQEFKTAVQAWDEFLQMPEAIESVIVADLTTGNISKHVK